MQHNSYLGGYEPIVPTMDPHQSLRSESEISENMSIVPTLPNISILDTPENLHIAPSQVPKFTIAKSEPADPLFIGTQNEWSNLDMNLAVSDARRESQREMRQNNGDVNLPERIEATPTPNAVTESKFRISRIHRPSSGSNSPAGKSMRRSSSNKSMKPREIISDFEAQEPLFRSSSANASFDFYRAEKKSVLPADFTPKRGKGRIKQLESMTEEQKLADAEIMKIRIREKARQNRKKKKEERELLERTVEHQNQIIASAGSQIQNLRADLIADRTRSQLLISRLEYTVLELRNQLHIRPHSR